MARSSDTDELIDCTAGRGEALRVEDVMRLLHLGRTTVYKMTREGELPSYRVGRQVRYRYEDVMARVGAIPAGPTGQAPSAAEGVPNDAQTAPVPLDPHPDVADELPAWMRGSLVVGGEDVCADILTSYLPGLNVKAVRAPVNGYVSLARMYLGTVHAAVVSLWSAGEDAYNLPFVRSMLPGVPVVALRLVRRSVGLTVRERGAFAPASWGDLLEPGVRLANRERGAEARVLLDGHLAALEAEPTALAGYDKVVTSEFAQALLVARGLADVAVTSARPAAQVDGLAFVPLQEATVDLVVVRAPQMAGLLRAAKSLLRTDAFRSEFDAKQYDTRLMGEVVYES